MQIGFQPKKMPTAKGPSPPVWARGTVIAAQLVLSEELFKGFHGKGLRTKTIPGANMTARPKGASVRNQAQEFLKQNMFSSDQGNSSTQIKHYCTPVEPKFHGNLQLVLPCIGPRDLQLGNPDTAHPKL